MHRVTLYLGMVIMLMACQKDKSLPTPEIAGIVGKWRLIEVESTQNGVTQWSSVGVYDRPFEYVIRFDGVFLDHEGFVPCCGPDSLTVNGVSFEITPKIKTTLNPMCASVSCFYCPNWEIEQNGDEMIITSCSLNRQKYVRE